ncbi:MAG: glycosyltransferase family 1 protein [Hydrogenophaga sp.]|jgi:glycosyltransferase involved in cell wall biosynthesis|nr:glycosyltransferase family 1 protein [Hydrogenophaga sp.]MDP2096686.1 glycosyltransferase family 1 protein [Hydrogenophaga sp.]MDP2219455.1 glycosyltransferase family 1 protein [Hydrogenophaga sp.]MDZ4239597.1 glycosyltransferase family 1 protein [Hydrogenophaga sp.]
MKILLITDAWKPQANSVVTTLMELVRELQAQGHEIVVVHPGQFRTWPCPGVAGLGLALFVGHRLGRMMDIAQADAIHIATEGPLGWAARRHCLQGHLPFTTAFHTKFPDILRTTLGIPLSWSYALLRRFHRPSSAVMVPTVGVLQMLQGKGFHNLNEWTHGVDTRLFAFAREASEYPSLGHLARPVSLCVGRVAAEKNIEAFLDMDVPGSKVVCGSGPLEVTLRERYPNVHWMGVVPRHELAHVYAAADVLVFPSRCETFGLVMLEAMASGLPVAAYPVDGPLQVVGNSAGGALREDLHEAWSAAVKIPREQARARAVVFGWRSAAERFVSLLAAVPHRTQTLQRFRPNFDTATASGRAVQHAKLSHQCHHTVE